MVEGTMGTNDVWEYQEDYEIEAHRRPVWPRLKTFLCNLKSFHHRIMMRYLRKRGWVVFYLEPQHRKCNGTCWLNVYESEQGRE